MDALQETSANQPFERGFQLDALEIDPLEGLVSGPGGREKLDPKIMAVFMLMMGRAGQIVSRDELLAQLWPNVVVTVNAVTRCFCVLRRQLCQAGGDPRYRAIIETLPKRGYRFTGEIALPEPPPAVFRRIPHRHATWEIAVAIVAAAAL